MGVTNITTRLIKDLAVSTAKLAANAVTLAKSGFLSAKGDLVTHTGSAHVAQAVGADGSVLTADSAQTNGIKWAVPLAATNFVTGETPSGTVDGVNATFTLANTPTAGTVKIWVNGVRMNVGAGNDYTISGTTITFLTGAIPVTGDLILTDYMK
jgi:archaellin